MGLTLEERKRRLIEGACESCGGGDDGGGDAEEGGGGETGEQPGADGEKLLGALAKIRKKLKAAKNGT